MILLDRFANFLPRNVYGFEFSYFSFIFVIEFIDLTRIYINN